MSARVRVAWALAAAAFAAVFAGADAAAQAPADAASVLRRIHAEGMERSRLAPLAQTLMDSVGPRLTGTPEQARAHEWAVATYAAWGIPARTEVYGSWPGWRRGHTRVDLLAPRVRTLEARLLAWSPGTAGPVTGAVATVPELHGPEAFHAWLETLHGRFLLLAEPPPTCRPLESWARWALPETLERVARAMAGVEHAPGQATTPFPAVPVIEAIEAAGAAGILTHGWTGGWGTTRVHAALTARVPGIVLSCEDYGLVHRLAARGQGPVLRVDADAEHSGDQPAANTVAEIRGTVRPEEYVILSAHFDSWDAGSGATDNATGTVVMMEAMRILRAVHPRPRRTILAGHWGGEEQGLNGSRAFTEDHPEVVAGTHVLLNQDTGTGRVDRISLQGFAAAGPVVRRWLARLPPELAAAVALDDPGMPSGGSSDHAAFVCHGVPGFWLLSTSWDYGTYTWHTDRDTFDKVSFDDLRRNAVLVAMLAYLAAEEPERLPRGLRDLPPDPVTGEPGAWPACVPADRSGR